MKSNLLAGWVMLTLLAAPGARAQTPECDRLSGEQQALARALLDKLHPYDCCDRTLAECLQQKPVCALTRRLADRVCAQVAAGWDRPRIERALDKRARSMVLDEKVYPIALAGAPAVGPPEAKVVLVEYACARCPFCSKITPKLHQALLKGPLAGKVRLVFRYFPIRSHDHSRESNLSLAAAARMGKFWEYLGLIYERFDVFCPKKLGEWAAEVGLPQADFEALLAEPATEALLVEAKKEGIRNGVEATPTFFLNGRRWAGELDPDEILDILGEEIDRVDGVETLP